MHDHDRILRDAYAAFARGDLEGYLAHCTPDITFTVPGHNKVSGVYSRAEFGPDMIRKVMQVTKGTFVETVLDVFTSARGGIVQAHHVFEADGTKREYRTYHVYDIRDGKLASFLEVPEHFPTFQEAWS